MDGYKERPSDAESRFRRKAVQVEEALERIRAHIRLMEAEEVPLAEAHGRRLAFDFAAGHDLPHFRRSGMDGYAIRSDSTAGASTDRPVVLEEVECIPCGATPTKRIEPGTASRIMTGAMVPEGADSVIMLEMTEVAERDGRRWITVKREMKPGQNVTPVAQEVARGDVVLERGTKIGPGEMALLAAFGASVVNVRRRPTVAIFSTGSELLPVEAPLAPGKIRNSNAYMLMSQLHDAGAIPLWLGAIPDNVKLAEETIRGALGTADLVLTTGGVSVGDYDILTDLFNEWEGTMLFNKVAMRPGSPTTVGVWMDKLVFALSGNPGACFVGFELFVRPTIRGMLGKKDIESPRMTAYLAEDFPKVNAFPRFVRGQSEVVEGKWRVRPAGLDQSGGTLSIRDADCLIVIPAGGGVRAGELVTVVKLDKPT